MTALLQRRLIVVTGKGGTGKTTVACALGLIAARRGLRTIVVEVGDQHRALDLFTGESPAGDRDHPGRGGARHARHAHDSHDAGHAHDARHTRHLHDARHAEEVELRESLWSTSIDPDRALVGWLQTLAGRIPARLLASSATFRYFAAAAPGAKELVSMIKVRQLCEGESVRQDAVQGIRGDAVQGTRGDAGQSTGEDAGSSARQRARGETARYDLVVLDAPATGHALAMLSSPRTFATIVRAGPLAEQARAVREMLEDPQRSGYVAVTHATEMAVTETLELEDGLRRRLSRDLDAVVVNGTVPRRFTRDELARIARLGGQTADSGTGEGEGTSDRVAPREPAERIRSSERHEPAGGSPDTPEALLVRSAARAARTAYERARLQQSQIARLRRRRFTHGLRPGVMTIPFAFTPELDLAGVRTISTQLERKL